LDLEQELGRRLKAGIKKNEPLSLHTSWKVGGPADFYLFPAGLAELVEIRRCSSKYGLPLFVLGNGTNLLVLDGGIRGLVVHIGSPFNYIHWEGASIRAGAGTPLPLLARATARKGLAGLEFAGGIPGTLGGALVMNAGAFGGNIGSLVREVILVQKSGAVINLSHHEIEFGYRHSNLPEKGIIVEALLQLKEEEAAVLEGKVEGYLAERMSRHPQLPSAGSVFRNLPERPAGSLIEAAGGKGMRIGGAQVSEQHANFIVNLGGATASDILALIKAVQKLVWEKFGVELQTEVRVVGEAK
jgi:UDP-N-acetylmuramate dehydrogenase